MTVDQYLVWDALVEMVTLNGRPFSSISDSGLLMILNPIAIAITEQHPEKWNALNVKNLRQAVVDEAARLRTFIKEEVQGRLISIKLDRATLKSGQSMLGVNTQFVRNGRLILRNLAVKELFIRHTGDNIRREEKNILRRYSIHPQQLYSATTDNAANMLKFVELINEDATTEAMDSRQWEPVVDEADEDNMVQEDDLESLSDIPNQDETASLTAPNDEFPEWFQDFAVVEPTDTDAAVISQRCAAHTIQLAVHDALEAMKCATLIGRARKLNAKLRVQSLMEPLT